jgi:hypothetical protein
MIIGDEAMQIYHGSKTIIERPEFGKGKEHNDFGKGFYCTTNIELAKEWGVGEGCDGFANCYTIDVSFLKVLELNSPDYTILNWIAVLLNYREFKIKNPVAAKAKRYLLDNFFVNVNAYDIVTGYRADDSYFDFAEAFLNNSISVQQLAVAMKLGKLGEQFVLKSRYAFSKLHFEGFERAERTIYYPKRKTRDDAANAEYQKILNLNADDLYMIDIIREQVKNDDPRIPRNICE